MFFANLWWLLVSSVLTVLTWWECRNFTFSFQKGEELWIWHDPPQRLYTEISRTVHCYVISSIDSFSLCSIFSVVSVFQRTIAKYYTTLLFVTCTTTFFFPGPRTYCWHLEMTRTYWWPTTASADVNNSSNTRWGTFRLNMLWYWRWSCFGTDLQAISLISTMSKSLS